MCADSDDPVVREIPVYLSKALQKQLFVFQHPIRPSKKPYDTSSIISARVKIKQQKVELNLPITTRGSHYDSSKGEQFALNVDGKAPESSDAIFRSNLMDTQTLTSSQAIQDASNYAIGTIKDGEIHFTPVTGVLQIRPSFHYLDKSDTRLNKSSGMEGGETSQEEEEPEATTVKVKFARRESDRVKQAREKSFAFLQQKLSEEMWKSLHVNSIAKSREKERLKLVCQSPNADSSIYFNIKPETYLSLLLPKLVDTETSKPEMPNNLLSMTQLRAMPITDQVRSLLFNSKLIKMSQLLALLPKDVDIQIVLRALQQVAVLVQGCWVVKSEVLYPKDTCSAHSGVPSELLCRARDYVMWCFTQNRCIIRKDLMSVIKLPQEDVKEMLEHMSHLRVNKGWEFIIPYNSDFFKKYPDVHQRQQMLWEAKYSSLCKAYNLTNQSESFKGMKPTSIPKPRQRRRRRTKSGHSTSGDESSGTDLSKKANNPTTKIEPASPFKNISNDNLNCPKNLESTMMDSDSSTVRFVPSPHLKNELTNFVKEMIASYRMLSISFLRKLLNTRLTESAPGHILSTGVSDALLHQTLVDCGGEAKKFKWSPENESVYMFWKLDDANDKMRRYIVEMFQANERYRFVTLKNKLDDYTGQTHDETELKAILKDYTNFKSGFYCFKYPGT